MAAVVSSVDFLGPHDSQAKGKPYSLRFDPPSGFPRRNFDPISRDQSFYDIRNQKDQYSVHRQGFEVLDIDTQMSYEDYDDRQKVETIYFPQVAQGLKNMLGASRVQIFEHVIRKRHAQFPYSTGQPYEHDQPTTEAHIDMTPVWASAMAEHMNERAGKILPSTNYQFINIWKPLRGPIKDWPLALCDLTSLEEDDVQAMDIVHSDTVIETFLVHHNEKQKWHYLRDQTEKEALVFLQADSAKSRYCGVPHSSFKHPDIESSEYPRESIEVRAIAFYDNED